MDGLGETAMAMPARFGVSVRPLAVIFICLLECSASVHAASLDSNKRQSWRARELVSYDYDLTNGWKIGSALAVGDFDGDGFSDLAIGARNEEIPGTSVGEAGAVHVIYGSEAREFTGSYAPRSYEGGLSVAAGHDHWYQGKDDLGGAPEWWDHFGWSLAAGDFDGDGKDDLAVGVPYEDVGGADNAGMVQVLYGSDEGLNSTGSQMWHQDTTGVAGAAETDDRFGYALAVGDFDGDGRDDLAIGVPGEDHGTCNGGGVCDGGGVNILYGSETGLGAGGDQWWDQDSSGVTGGVEEDDRFGWALAAGDFDGDGKDDLAIGVPYEDIGACHSFPWDGICEAGGVNVLYGSSGGLSASGDDWWDQGSPGIKGVPETMDRFGWSLAAGDFDGDGKEDLAIGAPYEDFGACNWGGICDGGTVNVIYGSSGGLTAAGDQSWNQNASGIKGVVEEDDRFGWVLAAGDFDADGKDDLAIGVPYEDIGDCMFYFGDYLACDLGVVQVLYGSGDGISSRDQVFEIARQLRYTNPSDEHELFGSSLAAGDFDGDGQGDLAIGVPGASVAWTYYDEEGNAIECDSGNPLSSCTGGSHLVDDVGMAQVIYGAGAVFNTAPVASADVYGATEDSPLSVAAPGLLANDSDTDADPLTVGSNSDAGHGSLDVQADGSFSYVPNADFCGEDGFSYEAHDGTEDSNTATVTLTVACVNDAPVADADAYAATEDEPLVVAAPGVLEGDTDIDGDAVSVKSNTQPAYGSVSMNADGSFSYTPTSNFCGADGFTYVATDAPPATAPALYSSPAQVSVTVACVNDAPVVTGILPASQGVDYSDLIAKVTVSVTDIDDVSTTLRESSEPLLSAAGLSLTPAGCASDSGLSPNPAEVGSVCSWTYEGRVVDPGFNSYSVLFTPADGDGDSAATGTHELSVRAEQVSAWLVGGNPVAAEVLSKGTDEVDFALGFLAAEWDATQAAPEASGDLTKAEGFMILEPVGPGGPVVEGPCLKVGVTGSGYDQVAEFRCEFDTVPVNTYEVRARVDGLSDTTAYYFGESDENVFVVYDPSLGFTTGAGWFYWPGTADSEFTACGEMGYLGDKTNFGFNMSYNKKRRAAKGSMMLLRHTVDARCLDAGSYKVKSNAIDGMALGDGEDAEGRSYGWATFGGKSTFREPGLEELGNHGFMVYVEDHGGQGCAQDPSDEFWIQARNKEGRVVLEVNGPDADPAGTDAASDGDDEPIACGNIAVPHKGGGGGSPPGKGKP